MRLFFNWLARRLSWHDAWRKIDTLTYLARAARIEPSTRQLSTCKSFESWVQEAQTAYRKGDYPATTEAIQAAVDALERLDADQRSLLTRKAAADRALEYRMHVANCCQ